MKEASSENEEDDFGGGRTLDAAAVAFEDLYEEDVEGLNDVPMTIKKEEIYQPGEEDEEGYSDDGKFP